MADVTILHNKNCSTSRFALDEADRLGVAVEVREYLKSPLDEASLVDLFGKLEDPVTDMVRQDNFFKEQGFDIAEFGDAAAVAKLLAEHPRLMQRPVLIRGDRAIIGRPKDRVEAFLAD
jgi:arsenate reductase